MGACFTRHHDRLALRPFLFLSLLPGRRDVSGILEVTTTETFGRHSRSSFPPTELLGIDLMKRWL